MDFTSAISHSSSRPLQIEIYIPPASSKKSSTGHSEPVIDLSSFSDDGFHDFTLDLGCMSPPPSPSLSGSFLSRTITRSDSSHGPAGAGAGGGGGLGMIGVPALPSPPSPRPLSFLQESGMTTSQLQEHSREQQRRTSQVLPSPKLSAITSASALQSSWPLTGRGTPVDHSRRSEWGSLNGDHHTTTTTRGNVGVGEDGVLFSTSPLNGGGVLPGRSSLDSAIRPSVNMTGIGAGSSVWLSNLRQLERSASRVLQRAQHEFEETETEMGTEGVSPVTVPLPPNTTTTTTTTTTSSLPEDSRINLQVDSDPAEWDSLMQTVLGSTSSSSSQKEITPVVRPHPPIIEELEPNTQTVDDNSPEAAAAISEIDQAFRTSLGLDDIAQFRVSPNTSPSPTPGTTRSVGGGGGTQAELSSACDSPSTYSTPPATPRESQSQINLNGNGVNIIITGAGEETEPSGVKQHTQSVHSMSTMHNHQSQGGHPSGWKEDRVPLTSQSSNQDVSNAGVLIWWKRFLSSLQRMQKSLRHPTSHHRRRF